MFIGWVSRSGLTCFALKLTSTCSFSLSLIFANCFQDLRSTEDTRQFKIIWRQFRANISESMTNATQFARKFSFSKYIGLIVLICIEALWSKFFRVCFETTCLWSNRSLFLAINWLCFEILKIPLYWTNSCKLLLVTGRGLIKPTTAVFQLQLSLPF